MAIVTENAVKVAVTANDMIERAYKILGDLGRDDPMTSSMASDGLYALNAMLDLFSVESLMIYVIRQESLTWTAATQSMTIGAGADLDTHRPDRILSGTMFRDSSNIDYPMRILETREAWDGIKDKTLQSTIPDAIFYEKTMSWGTLYVYPIPSASLTLLLNSYMPLQYFDTLTEAHTMPPGYQTMIEYNLAEFLQAETGLILSPNALRIAQTSKAAIKRNNHRPIMSETETAYVLHGRGRSDIYSGRP